MFRHKNTWEGSTCNSLDVQIFSFSTYIHVPTLWGPSLFVPES